MNGLSANMTAINRATHLMSNPSGDDPYVALQQTHGCAAISSLEVRTPDDKFLLNEVMHLLPQSFGFQATHSSSQGKPEEQQHSSSQLLFDFLESLPHLLPRQAFLF